MSTTIEHGQHVTLAHQQSTNSDNVTRRRQTSDVTDPGKRKYNPSRSRYNQARSRTRLNQPRLVQLAGPRRPKRVPLVIQAPLPGLVVRTNLNDVSKHSIHYTIYIRQCP